MTKEDFIFIENNWFREKYTDKSRDRLVTFKIALNWFLQHGGKNIVETGTTKAFDDWGAGMSTILFGDFCKHYGGHIWTIDKSEDAINMSKKVTVAFADYITYVQQDSVEALKSIRGKIDLLYLDSLDYPIQQEFPIPLCQEHQLAEIQAAYKRLSKRAVVLLDDNNFPGGGKTALSKRWLAEKGWVCLLDFQQTVWVRG